MSGGQGDAWRRDYAERGESRRWGTWGVMVEEGLVVYEGRQCK